MKFGKFENNKLKAIIETPDGERHKDKYLKMGYEVLDESKGQIYNIEPELKQKVESPQSKNKKEVDPKILRNRLLAASDWTQLVDSPLSEVKKKEWQAYRQELRDLPSKPNWPNDIQWPVKPGN